MSKTFKMLVEFSRETESGGIGLSEAGNFCKEVGELAKKYGFSAGVIPEKSKGIAPEGEKGDYWEECSDCGYCFCLTTCKNSTL